MLARRTTPEITRRIRAIGAKLRDRRLKLGMTQSKLSEVSGVDQPMISRIELGATIPLVSTIFLLCAGLGIDSGKVIRANFAVPEPVRRRRRPPINPPAPAPRVTRVLEAAGAD